MSDFDRIKQELKDEAKEGVLNAMIAQMVFFTQQEGTCIRHLWWK